MTDNEDSIPYMSGNVTSSCFDFEEESGDEGKIHDLGILLDILADPVSVDPEEIEIDDKHSPSTLCYSLCPAISADTFAEPIVPVLGGVRRTVSGHPRILWKPSHP